MNDVTPSHSGTEAASSFHGRLSPGDREKCRDTLISIIRQYSQGSPLGAELCSVGQGVRNRGLDYKAYGFAKLNLFLEEFYEDVEISYGKDHTQKFVRLRSRSDNSTATASDARPSALSAAGTFAPCAASCSPATTEEVLDFDLWASSHKHRWIQLLRQLPEYADAENRADAITQVRKRVNKAFLAARDGGQIRYYQQEYQGKLQNCASFDLQLNDGEGRPLCADLIENTSQTVPWFLVRIGPKQPAPQTPVASVQAQTAPVAQESAAVQAPVAKPTPQKNASPNSFPSLQAWGFIHDDRWETLLDLGPQLSAAGDHTAALAEVRSRVNQAFLEAQSYGAINFTTVNRKGEAVDNATFDTGLVDGVGQVIRARFAPNRFNFPPWFLIRFETDSSGPTPCADQQSPVSPGQTPDKPRSSLWEWAIICEDRWPALLDMVSRPENQANQADALNELKAAVGSAFLTAQSKKQIQITSVQHQGVATQNATFDTGLRSTGGQPIRALFTLNQHSGPTWFLVRFEAQGETSTPSSRDGLWRWAGIPDAKYRELSQLALPEKWGFGESNTDLGILVNYLNYTYIRLKNEDKILYRKKEERGRLVTYASFNTGLVDKKYEDIYALFKENDPVLHPQSPPWFLVSFCVVGEGKAGKTMNELFNPFPVRANYFGSRVEDIFYDTSTGSINCDYTHILTERLGRFPKNFIKDNCGWINTSMLKIGDVTIDDVFDLPLTDPLRANYFLALGQRINDEPRALNMLKNRFMDAVDRTIKRVEWNYKTAVPMYFPRRDEVSLLLPLSLEDDFHVDLALVVKRLPSGNYQGQTVLTLDMAYLDSRLITRPDSDWLCASAITSSSGLDDDQV